MAFIYSRLETYLIMSSSLIQLIILIKMSTTALQSELFLKLEMC